MYFGFQNISAAYGKTQIIRNLTLEVCKGETVTIVGPNGCGKSTLLKTVFGRSRISGDVILKGRPISDYKPKERGRCLSYLPQVHTGLPDIDVKTLISYGRYPHMRFGRGLSMNDKRIIDDTVEFTGLSAITDRQLSTLSGGELQRARVAMAVCTRPEILMLDEPTTHLDIGCQIEVLELIRRLKDELGMTVLTVLHDLNLAARYSDRMVAIKDGAIFAEGTHKEIMTEENLHELFGISANIRTDPKSGVPYFVPRSPLRKNSDSNGHFGGYS